MKVTVETLVFSSAFYTLWTILCLIYSIPKGIMASSIFITSLFGWMLTKRAEEAVNSHQLIILAMQVISCNFLCQLRSPISYKDTLCFSIKNYNWLLLFQHFQENCNQWGETSDQWSFPSAGHLWPLKCRHWALLARPPDLQNQF